MQRFFRWIDDLSGLQSERAPLRWLERASFVFLLLMTICAPHSIAATQTAWLLGMLAWTMRLFISPRPRFRPGPLDFALWAFFAWSVVSSVFSYAPDISIDKLRGASLFLIFYFVYYNLWTVRAARLVAVALIASSMIVVIWTPVERIFGRGVEVHGVRADSPLRTAKLVSGAPLEDGDTIIRVGKRRVGSPEELIREIERAEIAQVVYYRPDFNSIVEVRSADLLPGADAQARLGFESWKKSRTWRSSGFYGHYTTFAEVLQLVASLAFGIFIALFSGRGFTSRRSIDTDEVPLEGDAAGKGPENDNASSGAWFDKWFSGRRLAFLLVFCLAAMALALLLTVTRASQLALLISAAAIVLLSRNRRLIIAAAVIALPLALAGLIVLQQSRNVGFFDRKDNSITWRQTVYREAFDLWTADSRNFLLGVGMDSIKRYAREWRLFDDGRLPMGHFHSTPLQIAVERGLPALVFWFLILGVYAGTLRRALRFTGSASRARFFDERANLNSESPYPRSGGWFERGIILGCLGGLTGFFTSGLVHYNLGDGEVAMVFYLMMGVGMFLSHKILSARTDDEPHLPKFEARFLQ